MYQYLRIKDCGVSCSGPGICPSPPFASALPAPVFFCRLGCEMKVIPGGGFAVGLIIYKNNCKWSEVRNATLNFSINQKTYKTAFKIIPGVSRVKDTLDVKAGDSISPISSQDLGASGLANGKYAKLVIWDSWVRGRVI